MVVERVDMQTSFIENTVMQEMYIDDTLKGYSIRAAEGYIMHDKNYDTPVLDENYNETGKVILGFRPPALTATVAANYDFTTNPREFYTVLESEKPSETVNKNIGEATTSDLYNALAELGVE